MMELRDISISSGAFSLKNLGLTVPSGSYGVLMGRTGSGKTTLIEIICGLRRLTAGKVILNGRDVTKEPPGNRGLGFVPQEGALFPTLTVHEQLGFAPRIRKWPREMIDARVRELAKALEISHLLDRMPDGLSGGERQRIALGRALSARPSVLLLDEPLSALDEQTRGSMRDLLKTVQRETGVTVLHVTHDSAEAKHLADVLFVIEEGTVREAAAV